MMNFLAALRRSSRHPKLAQVVLVGALSTAGLLTGVVPQFDRSTQTLSLETAASAQSSPDNNTVRRLAQAMFEVEQLRGKKLAEAKARLGGNRTDCLHNVPAQVQDICSSFHSQSGAIVRKYGFSAAEFKDLAQRATPGSDLERRIQREMICIQTPTAEGCK